MTSLAKALWAVIFLTTVAVTAAFLLAVSCRLVYEAGKIGWSVVG